MGSFFVMTSLDVKMINDTNDKNQYLSFVIKCVNLTSMEVARGWC